MMDYSIVIPVFNREDLTRNCLATLLPTLEGAGEGEIIIVDNGSRPATAAVLAAFPWARVIRNETNLGFAAACNQGARAAAGRVICHLNNDIIANPGWLANMLKRLEPDVGIVGARLFFPDDKIQHAGVAIFPARFGIEGIGPHHIYWRWPRATPVCEESTDFQIVTGACLVTPRDLFLSLGGFDETFWNGYEDVDYCLRVGERGLRVVYEASATLYHHESQSGVQRKRRLAHNVKTLSARWGARIEPDHNRYWPRQNYIRREIFVENYRNLSGHGLPPVTLIVHGKAPQNETAFLATLRDNRVLPQSVVWIAEGNVPSIAGVVGTDQPPLVTLRDLVCLRGDKYLAFVNTQTQLEPGWLDELINVIEYGSEVMASTVTAQSADVVEPVAADGRCTLLNLRSLPLHVHLAAVDTVDGAVADLTWRGVQLGLGVRAVRKRIAVLGEPIRDEKFAALHGSNYDEICYPDRARMESACADPPAAATFTSIIMLSWNAPGYTRMAVESIREFTRCAYEIIIIDNGSDAETLTMLAALSDVRVIYNDKNMGFAYGCNQGIAAAAGTHVVLLNNDVVVTQGWLENLLAGQRRDPLAGVSAPRSNRIVGHQQVNDLQYNTVEGMHAFAAERSYEFAGMQYRTDRAIGFCLCISRAVIDEVGGIDTRYGVGNFEDDDFCVRVRAAGYQIVICEDAFIHHFGSVSFTANNVDYSSQMQKNWQVFAARWNLPAANPERGYNASPAIARGFVRARDYVALTQPEADVAKRSERARRSYATAFVAVVDGEAAWSRVGPVVTNYIKALSVEDSSLFAICVTGEADAATIGARIGRSIDRLQVDQMQIADIDVVDVALSDLEQWVAAIPAAARLSVWKDDRLADLTFAADRSPSGIARTVRGARR